MAALPTSLLPGKAGSSFVSFASARYLDLPHPSCSMVASLSVAGSEDSLCLQACTFKVDYTLENIPGREFGSVFIGTPPENVALTVVKQGWAKVRLLVRYLSTIELIA